MKRGYIYAAVFVVGIVGLFYVRQKTDKRIDAGIKAPVLSSDQQAKVIVDPRRHTVTTVTRRADGGTNTVSTFLPPTGASVSVGLDKSVLVTARSWGTEVSPFVGFALGSDIVGRAALGLDVFYLQRWELGGGLLVGGNVKTARVYAQVSYNGYGNMFVGLGIDNQRTAHITAGLKF